MIHRITAKFEIDVMHSSELQEATELASVHNMHALVVHPELISRAVISRGIRQGQYKIITPIDWPKGEQNGMLKMRGINVDALSQDGFEILLSESDNRSEIKNELSQLVEFIKGHLPPMVEVRIVLDTFSRDKSYWEMVCDILKEIPAPQLIRNDHNLKIQQSRANAAVHQETMRAIRSITACPIKISGNINSIKTIATCKADKYAMNLRQVNTVLAEIRKDPRKINELSAAAT